MFNLTISDLQPTKLNQFSDFESYLKDLDESEQKVQGGLAPLEVFVAGFGIGYYGVMAGAAMGEALVEHLLWKDGV